MLRIVLLFHILAFICYNSVAQTVTAKQIKKVFRLSIERRKESTHAYTPRANTEWMSPNDKDEYDLADTIRLYNSRSTHLFNKKSLHWILWKFQRRNHFYFIKYEAIGCGMYETFPSVYRIKVYNKEKKVFLNVYANDTLQRHFLVSSLDSIVDKANESYNKLVLIRLK